MQHPLNEIKAFFRKLKEKHKTLVKFVDSIAENSMKSDTRMKNQIFAVHITDDVDSTQEKRKIYIQCLVHASKYNSLHDLQPCIHSSSLIV